MEGRLIRITQNTAMDQHGVKLAYIENLVS